MVHCRFCECVLPGPVPGEGPARTICTACETAIVGRADAAARSQVARGRVAIEACVVCLGPMDVSRRGVTCSNRCRKTLQAATARCRERAGSDRVVGSGRCNGERPGVGVPGADGSLSAPHGVAAFAPELTYPGLPGIVLPLDAQGSLRDADGRELFPADEGFAEALRAVALGVGLCGVLVARFGATRVPALLAEALLVAYGFPHGETPRAALAWYRAARSELAAFGELHVRGFPLVEPEHGPLAEWSEPCWRCVPSARRRATGRYQQQPGPCLDCRGFLLLVRDACATLPTVIARRTRAWCLVCSGPREVAHPVASRVPSQHCSHLVCSQRCWRHYMRVRVCAREVERKWPLPVAVPLTAVAPSHASDVGSGEMVPGAGGNAAGDALSSVGGDDAAGLAVVRAGGVTLPCAGPGCESLRVASATVFERRAGLGAALERVARGVDADVRAFHDVFGALGFDVQTDSHACPSPSALSALLDEELSDAVVQPSHVSVGGVGASHCLGLEPSREGWRARVPGTALEVRAEPLAPCCASPAPAPSGTIQLVSYPLWRISLDDAGAVECWSVFVEGDLYACRARLVCRDGSVGSAGEVEVESVGGELDAFAARLAQRVSVCVGPA